MKIEVKNIKVNLAFSEETTMFKADVYVKGIKAGYAQNDGHGGSTWVNAYEGKIDLLNDAEAHCKAMPPEISTFGDKTMELPMSLDFYIDLEVDKFVNKREADKFIKKMEKNMITSIIYGVPNSGSYRQVGYRVPLATVPKPQLQALVDKYKKELKEGEKILNTNLEALGIAV